MMKNKMRRIISDFGNEAVVARISNEGGICPRLKTQ